MLLATAESKPQQILSGRNLPAYHIILVTLAPTWGKPFTRPKPRLIFDYSTSTAGAAPDPRLPLCPVSCGRILQSYLTLALASYDYHVPRIVSVFSNQPLTRQADVYIAMFTHITIALFV